MDTQFRHNLKITAYKTLLSEKSLGQYTTIIVLKYIIYAEKINNCQKINFIKLSYQIIRQ